MVGGPQRVIRTTGRPKARRQEVEATKVSVVPKTDRKGRLSVGDDDRVVDVTFGADYTPWSTKSVTVDLDHVPTHFRVEMIDFDDDSVEDAGNILPRNKSAWTAKTIYVACSATHYPMTARLMVY